MLSVLAGSVIAPHAKGDVNSQTSSISNGTSVNRSLVIDIQEEERYKWHVLAYLNAVQERELQAELEARAAAAEARASATPTYTYRAGVQQWAGYVAQFNWDVSTALAIMSRESGGSPTAYNPSGASGLFQIICYWHTGRLIRVTGSSDCSQLFDPYVNIRVAYEIYKDNGGWGAWAIH